MIAISFVATRRTYAILICVTVERDCWAAWVARMRPDGDGEDGDHPHWRWRDRILLAAEPIAGETVLDIGCGEGLVAFGALDRGAREVVFDDVSEDLLAFCRAAAHERGVLDRCRFVRASAEELAPVDAASVDVVTTRSVLIYVEDKRSAFREFARVLRPGGRLSIFEPINRFARRGADTWGGYDLSPLPDIARKIRAVYEALQPPDTDPMLDFDERDLAALAERAGFFPIRLELEAEVRSSEPARWDVYVDTAGNPRIPTLAEAMREALTPAERERLTSHLRPLVEEGRGTWRMATAFLHAIKP
jgi:ubiquinone/menaquinone biosynthesis C-methylase UbiE